MTSTTTTTTMTLSRTVAIGWIFKEVNVEIIILPLVALILIFIYNGKALTDTTQGPCIILQVYILVVEPFTTGFCLVSYYLRRIETNVGWFKCNLILFLFQFTIYFVNHLKHLTY